MTKIEHLDDKFDFGKFKGCTFAEVVEYSPDYIQWVVENVDPEMCIFYDSVIEELRLIFPRFEITSQFEEMRKTKIEEYEYIKEAAAREESSVETGYYEYQTYERYSGSYAQNEMGYSDDDIDTIFEGDPDAYWNID